MSGTAAGSPTEPGAFAEAEWAHLIRPEERHKRAKPRVVVALGGNALLPAGGRASYQEQYDTVRRASVQIADFVAHADVVLTHGNGPQVGNLVLENEAAAQLVPHLPLDVFGAETQGQIGYMLCQTLANALTARGRRRPVVAVVTQVVVAASDPAFARPTKPIGPHFSRAVADQRIRDKGETWTEVPHHGWRRIVPSPEPLRIVEHDTLLALVAGGAIVIACGGGGIPVIEDRDRFLTGVEAVVDKDAATCRLAVDLEADALLLLTDVAGAAIDFGRPTEHVLRRITVDDLEAHMQREDFGEGTMLPKVQAACAFIRGGGRQATICALGQALAGLRGDAGTVVRLAWPGPLTE